MPGEPAGKRGAGIGFFLFFSSPPRPSTSPPPRPPFRPPRSQDQLRTALALGADRAIHVALGASDADPAPTPRAVAAVLAGIETLPTRGLRNDYVIQGHSHGEHMVCLQYCWQHIRKAARLASDGEVDLDQVRLHDLRHTHASWGVMSGLSLPKVGNLLGHTQPSTTQRYGHFATDPRLEASEQISSKINSALGF